jgi:membrane protein DedA with SNARE-associated domain
MDFLSLLVNFFSEYGYFAVFGVLILCGFGLPVPEDITLVSGGVISAVGNTNVHFMFIVGMLGVLVGDSIVFLLGKFYGEKILKIKIVSKFLTEKRYNLVQEKFEKYGKWVVFMARFMPGLRTPIFLTAGLTNKVSFIRFFLTDFFASIISVPIWIYLGYYFANNFSKLKELVHNGQIFFISLVGVILVFFVVKYFINRGK